MSGTTQTHAPAIAPKVSSGATASRILQRKCACGGGGASALTGQCDDCSKKLLQRKLAIGASNDPFELEADRVAEQVMSMREVSRVGASPPRIQRLSGQPSGELHSAPSSVERVLASSGRPLDPGLRSDMEQRFGHDFSHVRVHSDTSAAESARAVRARAYTVGGEIVFGRGQYAPSTSGGKKLLAHELTHVVQQSSGNVMSVQRDADKDLTADIVRELTDHVANNPSPYKHVIEAVRFARARDLDDDVAAQFTEAQSAAQLEAFAGTPDGLEMLDVLYRAMITGTVSRADNIQSARIVYAKWKRDPRELYKAAQLSDPELDSPFDKTVTLQADRIANSLRKSIANKRYADLLKGTRVVQGFGENDYIEDDVASRLTSLLSPQKLEELAADVDGRGILDALYDALITGSVTEFEKLQANRVLDARKKVVAPQTYVADIGQGKIFPLSDPIFGESATFTAALREGKVHVRYQTGGIRRDPKFKKAQRGLPDSITRRDLVLEPDEVVQVKLYDEDGGTKSILAIELIDHAEQTQGRFEGRAATVVGAAVTVGTGTLGAGGVRALAVAVEAGQASKVALALGRVALWSERAAFGLQIATAVAHANRRWILKKFGKAGEDFLSVLEEVNKYSEFVGNVNMAIDGFRFFGSKLRPAWEKFRKTSPTELLNDAERKAVDGLNDQVDNALHEVDAGNAVAAVNKNPRAYPIKESGGQRYTDLGDGHQIIEVRGKGPSGVGIGCEYHSDTPVPVPCTGNFQAASPPILEPAGPDAPHVKRRKREHVDKSRAQRPDKLDDDLEPDLPETRQTRGEVAEARIGIEDDGWASPREGLGQQVIYRPEPRKSKKPKKSYRRMSPQEKNRLKGQIGEEESVLEITDQSVKNRAQLRSQKSYEEDLEQVLNGNKTVEEVLKAHYPGEVGVRKMVFPTTTGPRMTGLKNGEPVWSKERSAREVDFVYQQEHSKLHAPPGPDGQPVDFPVVFQETKASRTLKLHGKTDAAKQLQNDRSYLPREADLENEIRHTMDRLNQDKLVGVRIEWRIRGPVSPATREILDSLERRYEGRFSWLDDTEATRPGRKKKP